MMNKIAFKMKLKAGFKDEYKLRHDHIWEELKVCLKKAGISDYSIFFDEESHTLFAVQYIFDHKSAADLGNQEIVKEWWCHMADIMETQSDFSPVVCPLELMFHMD